MADAAPTSGSSGGAPGGSAPAGGSAPPTTAKAPATGAAKPASAPSAAPSTSTATPAAPPPRKHKIGDREYSDSEYIDELKAAHGEEGLAAIGGLGRALRQKLSKAGEEQRKFEAALADLRDPAKALALLTAHLGAERAHEVMERHLAARYKAEREDKQNPRGREERELAERVERLRAEEERLTRAERERSLAATVEAAKPKLGKIFVGALGAAGIPDAELRSSPHLMADLVAMIEAEDPDPNMSRGEFDLLVRECATEIAKRHRGRDESAWSRLPAEKRKALVAAEIASMKPEEVYAALGDAGVRAFRAHDAAKVRERNPATGQFVGKRPNGNGAAPTEKPRIHVDDFYGERW